MAPPYVEPLVRFGVGLLVAAVMMAVVVRAVPGTPADMEVSLSMKRPVDEVVAEHLSSTWQTVSLGVGLGLPLALLLGIPAGLRPHSLLDRGLQGPVVALMGVPAFALMLFLMVRFALPPSGDISVQDAFRTGLVIIWAAWMARAVRDGIVGARAGGSTGDRADASPTRDQALRTVAAVAGRILQQAGNLAVFLMVAEGVGGIPGVMQLMTTGLFVRDVPLVIGALRAVFPALLVAHLLGDLLVTYGEGRPPSSVCRVWLITGGVMAAALLVTALLPAPDPTSIDIGSRLLPPGTPGHPLGTDQLGRDLLGLVVVGARLSLWVTAIALLIAAVGEGVLGSVAGAIGRWGGVLSPRVVGPGLWAPVFVALCLLLLNRPGPLVTAVAAGVASILGMAMGFRWLVRRRAAGQGHAALVGFSGVLALVAAQILLTQFTLDVFGLATQPPVHGLGGVVREVAISLRFPPITLYLTIPAVLGSAGLFLVGHALTDAAGTRLEGAAEGRQSGEQAEA